MLAIKYQRERLNTRRFTVKDEMTIPELIEERWLHILAEPFRSRKYKGKSIVIFRVHGGGDYTAGPIPKEEIAGGLYARQRIEPIEEFLSDYQSNFYKMQPKSLIREVRKMKEKGENPILIDSDEGYLLYCAETMERRF